MTEAQYKRVMTETKHRLEEHFRAEFCLLMAGRQDITGDRDPSSLQTREMMDIADQHPELFKVH